MFYSGIDFEAFGYAPDNNVTVYDLYDKYSEENLRHGYFIDHNLVNF